LKFRLAGQKFEPIEVVEPQPAREHDSEVLREFVAMGREPAAETQPQKTRNIPEFWKRAVFQFSPYDLVYYVVAGVCCFGIVSVLDTVGLAVAFCYFGVSVIALQRCKDENEDAGSEVDMGAVIFLEVLVSVPFDLAWINEVLWRNVSALPLRIEGVILNGEQTWRNGGWPFFVALYVSVLLASTAVYACYSTLKLAKRRVKNEVK